MSVGTLLFWLFIGLPVLGSLVVFVLGVLLSIVQALTGGGRK